MDFVCPSGVQGPFWWWVYCYVFTQEESSPFILVQSLIFLFSPGHLKTEDGPVSGGVIIVVVSVGGVEPVGGCWRVVPVLVFSS